MYFNFINVTNFYKNFLILLWNFCEFFHISLGRFSPIIFGIIIGKKGHKIE